MLIREIFISLVIWYGYPVYYAVQLPEECDPRWEA